MQVTPLNHKAIKVKLTMRRANLVRRDIEAEAAVQVAMDDASLVVNSRFFRDKTNTINKIMAAVGEVYTYHKAHTLPYVDKGPRILPNERYMEYTSQMRQRIGIVDSLLAMHMPMYDHYVAMDIAYRSKDPNKPARAKAEDYPSAEDFQARLGFDLRFEPLPETKHFLFDISDDDVANFEKSLEDAARIARNDAVGRMLNPLKHLSDKLNKPIGTDGSIFRDSALENITEGIEVARSLMIDAPQEFNDLCDQLQVEVKGFNTDWLRESPINRVAAAKKLADIQEKMRGLFT